MMNATYSPEDNKLRLYSEERLDAEMYQRVRKAGFIWAAKQKLFVAPMWTPSREDLLIELCGEIEDEDKSLVERAEERAERFDEYSDHRAEDAHRAKESVAAIADGIPFGQPILIGHHSERRARKDAEKIENGMRKAVKMWETAKYWEDRAKGALAHAKYKEIPAVRARRIKGLESDLRKQEKGKKEAEQFIKLWESIEGETLLKFKEGEQTKERRALWIANRDYVSKCFTLAEYPRELPKSQYEGSKSIWSAMTDGIINADQAQEISVRVHTRAIKHNDRWISHLTNRLTYEKAMLEEAGASKLIEKKPRPKQLPLCNYRAPEGVQVPSRCYGHKGEFETYQSKEMTKAEYMAIYEAKRGTREVENSHRVRVYVDYYHQGGAHYVVFLTDQKVTAKPEPIKQEPRKIPVEELREKVESARASYVPPERTEFDAMKETLKAGIKTVCAPQLFPTPREIAEKMNELLNVEVGHDVLEPSAGTGNLVGVLGCSWKAHNPEAGSVTAVEINKALADRLAVEQPLTKVICDDFLNCNGNLGKFDRVIMNPPFENGSDIKHIQHARTFLKPGGRLVALCANGSRQRAAFMDIAEHWEDLPEGSFKNQGTGVNVALMVLTA
jgi:protein-L-isoaspartate O-methyltransferase